MLTRLNHIAIACQDLAKASRFYADTLGAKVGDPQELSDHGVRVAFVKLQNTVIELLEPFGENSPIAGFLSKSNGGIHHICIETDDIDHACQTLSQKGVRILGDGMPKIGAHGKPVIFLHPKDCFDTLIELEQS
ncbi:MAG: methylmalonyl-CoA epimerase [Pseudomonadota bacterium]